jgi:hypothetical protein
MSITTSRTVAAGIFFIMIFIFGFWLHRSGKPYNSLLLNIHKLIALAALVLFVREMVLVNQIAALSTLALTVGVLTVLLFVVGIITGGLVSIDKPMPAVVLGVHQVAPYLTVFSTAATLYLLSRPA